MIYSVSDTVERTVYNIDVDIEEGGWAPTASAAATVLQLSLSPFKPCRPQCPIPVLCTRHVRLLRVRLSCYHKKVSQYNNCYVSGTGREDPTKV